MTCCPGHSLRDVRTPEASKLSQSIATKLANFFASYRIRLLRGIRPLIPMGLNHRLGTKRASARRTRSPGAGRGAAPGPALPRTSAPQDQRTKSAYIFGAICPAKGKGAGLVLPKCNTAAMQRHLDEIALVVDPGAHALVMLDQAGWPTTDKLILPDNSTLLPLPPKAPELKIGRTSCRDS